MIYTTADLCDAHSEEHHFQIAEPLFKPYGAHTNFCGQITTVKVFEDDILIRSILEQKVENRVLVIDGGGSHRCALLGESLVRIAIDNGWQGIVVHGCIRDSAIINQLAIGIRALHTHPLKSHKRDPGDQELLVTFAGVNFKQNHFLYADADGMVVSEAMLS
jgi:regulator of ribonuclease activity A